MSAAEPLLCPECGAALPIIDTGSEDTSPNRIVCTFCGTPLILRHDAQGHLTATLASIQSSTRFLALTEACKLLSQDLLSLEEELGRADSALDSCPRPNKLNSWLCGGIFLLFGALLSLIGLAMPDSSTGLVGLTLVLTGAAAFFFMQRRCRKQQQQRDLAQERISNLKHRLSSLHQNMEALEAERRRLISDL